VGVGAHQLGVLESHALSFIVGELHQLLRRLGAHCRRQPLPVLLVYRIRKVATLTLTWGVEVGQLIERGVEALLLLSANAVEREDRRAQRRRRWVRDGAWGGGKYDFHGSREEANVASD
jgi:hypothetical protein